MAQYIRFRLTAAKVGVTVTFFALLAGLADKARAVPLPAKPAPPANFLKEISIPTGGGLDRIVIQKLDSALATIEHKLASTFETTHKINQTFLKIKSADTSFLKIKSANTNFLKIKSANTDFLKIDDANTNFLKIDDASAQFLKLTGTAANSSQLGGLTPSQFFQGNGHVVTGAVSDLATSNTPTVLLPIPGGISVSVTNTVGSGLQLGISNPTGQTLAAVIDNGTGVAEHDLNPSATTSLPVTGTPAQLHIQIFPNSGLAEAVTIIISVETSTTRNPSIVAQAFTGAA
jgi:hypothetical protein